MGMKQFVITSAAAKRLIGRALAVHPAVEAAAKEATLVIVAGTTNGYVAEELLKRIDPAAAGRFTRMGFRRGTVTPPGFDDRAVRAQLHGDVIITKGAYLEGKTIFDVADDLTVGDLILKGANAVDLRRGQAAAYIADPQAGTAGAAIRAVVGRRVRLIIPVSTEKRVPDDIATLAAKANAPDAEGPRMLPLPGEVYTELDALEQLTGATATLMAAGGIYGAEGAVWLGLEGTAEQLAAAEHLIGLIGAEPPCKA